MAKKPKLRQVLPILSLVLAAGCTVSSKPNIKKETPKTTPSSSLTWEKGKSPGLSIAEKSNFTPDADRPLYLRDYKLKEPLPQTGKVTTRSDIKQLDASKLFASCPADSAPYGYAESSNYKVLLCSLSSAPKVPKYYIMSAKDGSGSLSIDSQKKIMAYQLKFQHRSYLYHINRDGVRPETINAYLEVTQPNGKTYAEALLYLYEYNYRR